MRGSDGYQRDRNTRLAILNEQERNRKPTTAGKDATINLDTLPEQLKQVYAQRAENAATRRDGSWQRLTASCANRSRQLRSVLIRVCCLAVPAVFMGWHRLKRYAPTKCDALKRNRIAKELVDA